MDDAGCIFVFRWSSLMDLKKVVAVAERLHWEGNWRRGLDMLLSHPDIQSKSAVYDYGKVILENGDISDFKNFLVLVKDLI